LISAWNEASGHRLPKSLEATRSFRRDASTLRGRVKASIPILMAVRRSEGGIRLLFLLLKHMLKIKVTACESCGSLRPAIRELVYPDGHYIAGLTNLRPRSPPALLQGRVGANTVVA